jgi:hypothetical protein
MKKALLAQVGFVVVAAMGTIVVVGHSNSAFAVSDGTNVGNVGGSVSLSNSQIDKFQVRSKISIPDLKVPVIPSPTPGASDQVKKECSEALVAAVSYASAVNKCTKELTAEYNALTVPKLHDFAVKIGLSDTDVLDSTKVKAAIKAKCEADSAALKSAADTAIEECKAAAANKESVCGRISKALAAQKKRRDELKAELAKVEAKIAANEKAKSDNGCQ